MRVAMERERERAVHLLQEAFADEVIEVEELEQRLERVAQAETPDALAAITSDLPVVVREIPDESPPVRVLAILGGAERKGEFVMPARMSVTAWCGGADIDLRLARFSGSHELSCSAVMGGISILVPGHVRVTCRGLGIMGGFSDRSRGTDDSSAPELVITGVAFWGGVDVQTRGATARRLPAPRTRR